MKLAKRKPTRLKGYYYSTLGAYFITIYVKDRRKLLSKIVGDDAHIETVIRSFKTMVTKEVITTG